MKTAIVIGVGPDRGLGAQLCERLAKLDLHVFVAGRTQAKLDAVVGNIVSASGSATAILADATDGSGVKALFKQAAEQGALSVASYNAGNAVMGSIGEMTTETFTDAWKVCCLGGFLFGREAIRKMSSTGGTILYTGATGSLRGAAGFGAFNSSKAGLRALAQAMAKECGKDGIHVGHVIIDGAINGEKIKISAPEYYEKLGDEGMLKIESIVDVYEYLYKQPKSGWSFEADVRTSIAS
jgi:NAD(P)-dependent dehydrogenase (short-subunit alcohol dehydrogenase family)